MTKRDTATRRPGDAAKSRGEPTVSASQRLRVSASLLVAFCLLPLAFASAHEPITTKVRFNKELVRILQRNCLSCHHPGGIAMSLATYDEARPWAKAIKEEVLEKRMPPWRAVKGYGDFRNAPSLTQRDVDLIVNWVEGGAPKGDDKDLPAGPLFSNDWQLGEPDLILKPASESKIAADADEYRSFVLPTDLKEDRWLTAIDLQPGNGAVVHCATFYLVTSDARAQSPEQMMQIKNDESGSSRHPVPSALATWIPGQKTVAFDYGVSQLLPAGSRIGMRIHYHGVGEPGTDLSRVGLYFEKASPRKHVQELQITKPDAVVSVGAETYQLKLSVTALSDAEAIAIRPIVHPLIASLQATAYRPDGSEEVLIWTRGYQFDWEPTYSFKKPVTLPKGTRVEVIAYFDNSGDNQNNPNNPPRAMRLSELSAEPLCTLFVASSDADSTPNTPR
jgi:hypothetical protein